MALVVTMSKFINKDFWNVACLLSWTHLCQYVPHNPTSHHIEVLLFPQRRSVSAPNLVSAWNQFFSTECKTSVLFSSYLFFSSLLRYISSAKKVLTHQIQTTPQIQIGASPSFILCHTLLFYL